MAALVGVVSLSAVLLATARAIPPLALPAFGAMIVLFGTLLDWISGRFDD